MDIFYGLELMLGSRQMVEESITQSYNELPQALSFTPDNFREQCAVGRGLPFLHLHLWVSSRLPALGQVLTGYSTMRWSYSFTECPCCIHT